MLCSPAYEQVPGTTIDPFGLLHDFLRGGKYGTTMDFMDSALHDKELGAAVLVVVCAQLRDNGRTRHSMTTLATAHGHSPWPRWFGVFAREV